MKLTRRPSTLADGIAPMLAVVLGIAWATGCLSRTPEVSCTTTRPPTAPSSHRAMSQVMGLDGPVVIENASFTWGWVAACFATEDSNHDGKIEVTIGHHGNTFGDDLYSYLISRDAGTQPIEEYIGASRDGQYLSVIRDSHLWLIDASTSTWQDLSLTGAVILADDSPALPHPAITFSRSGLVAYVRKRHGPSEVVLLNPDSQTEITVLKTDNSISRIEFSSKEPLLYVWHAPGIVRKRHNSGVWTTLAPRLCRGQPASHSIYGRRDKPTTEVKIPSPMNQMVPKPAEGLLAEAYDCTPDGRPAVASTPDGKHLVAARYTPYTAEVGPLQWVEGPLARRYCFAPCGE